MLCQQICMYALMIWDTTSRNQQELAFLVRIYISYEIGVRTFYLFLDKIFLVKICF